jgi:hypothetical protein
MEIPHASGDWRHGHDRDGRVSAPVSVRQFVDGTLGEGTGKTLAEHLAECTTCLTRLWPQPNSFNPEPTATAGKGTDLSLPNALNAPRRRRWLRVKRGCARRARILRSKTLTTLNLLGDEPLATENRVPQISPDTHGETCCVSDEYMTILCAGQTMIPISGKVLSSAGNYFAQFAGAVADSGFELEYPVRRTASRRRRAEIHAKTPLNAGL